MLRERGNEVVGPWWMIDGFQSKFHIGELAFPSIVYIEAFAANSTSAPGKKKKKKNLYVT